ncbi:MAG: oligopeptidase B [Oligoflexia bacterium]|nr:MAG: oligopeptidase B [Oligoflexia bacterium]
MSCATIPQAVLKGPVATKIPHEHKHHGDVRVDNYYWMKNRDSEPVLTHLKAENNYTQSVMQDTEDLQEKLYQEMRSRIKEDDSSPPYKYGDYFYYTRYETGKEYPIYCRKLKSLDAKEEITLDVNVIGKNEKYISVGAVVVSPNHQILAYAVDTVGRYLFQVKFIDLKTGKHLPDVLDAKSGNFVWANDNKTLFYTQKHPETLRQERVYRYKLGSNKPEEIYYEKDEVYSVHVRKTLTKNYIILHTGSFDSSEEYILDANNPSGQFKVFLSREKKHEYNLDDGGDGFYIYTNWKAKNFRLMKTEYAKWNRDQWKEVIAHDDQVYLEGVDIFKTKMVLQERFQGLTRLRILDRNSQKSETIQFPDPTYVVSSSINAEYETDRFRYVYESPVRPRTHYDFLFGTYQSQVVKILEVPNFNAENYKSERVWATAQDGTKIPISLIYRKDFVRDGSRPLLMYGYGSYGYSMDPYFSSARLSLVDRGFIYAIAHIRGGSEMGRDWYDGGRMMNKKNTFTDFNSCTEYLVQNKYGHPQKVYAMGGSAGGLLMGAVINLRPDLYKGIVAGVPFVDMLNSMLDPTIPLTAPEYEQWGNPNEKPAYDYMKSYSPYDNVGPKVYPNILAVTGYHDSQVQYWEPMKWVAKIRELQTGKNLVLLKTNMDAGHSGASGRFEHLHETALEYAFFLKLEGIH